MFFLDELKDLLIYKKSFYLPIDESDKKKNSAVFLLTPNGTSSRNMMKKPYILNKRAFESYYVEKSIYQAITSEGECITDTDSYLSEASINNRCTTLYETFPEIADLADDLDDDAEYITEEEPEEDEPVNESAIRHIESVSAVIIKNGKLLVQSHIRAGGLNLPGGKLNQGDTPETALKRELMEELGIEVTKFSMLYDFTFPFKYLDEPYDYMAKDTVFLIQDYNGEIVNAEPHKHKFIKYMQLREIQKNPNNTKILNQFINTVSFDASKYRNIYTKSNIIFSGSQSDILVVSGIITPEFLKGVFNNIGLKTPKSTIHVVVTKDADQVEYVDNTMITVLSKEAYTKKYTGEYYDYILLLAYVFAYKTVNANLNSTLAYSLAMFKSGGADRDTKIKDKDDSGVALATIWARVYDEGGNRKILDLVNKNDLKHMVKYGATKRLNEESMTDIKKLSIKIKKAGKRGSAYKINKIVRDLEKLYDIEGDIKYGDGEIRVGLPGPPPAPSMPSAKSESADYMRSLLKEDQYVQMENGIIYLEAGASSYDAKLKQLLYTDRLKTATDVMKIYDGIKTDLPFIKYTFIDINRYKNRNLYIDLSYYNEVFFKNNTFIGLKAVDLYMEMIDRLINDSNIKSIYPKRTVFIPVLDWNINNSTKMWMYKEGVHPVSMIYQLMKNKPARLKDIFGDMDVVFLGENNYFKINFSKVKDISKEATKFTSLVRKLVDAGVSNSVIEDPIDEPTSSPKAIKMDIIDKIEDAQGIKINNVASKVKSPVVTTVGIPKPVVKPTVAIKTNDKVEAIKSTKVSAGSDAVNTVSNDKKKEELVEKIDKAVQDSTNTDEAIAKLEEEEFKRLLIDLASEEDNKVKINKARSARINELQNQFVDKQINGKSVKDLLLPTVDTGKLDSTKLKLGTINKDWEDLTFINFDKNYDIDADIIKMLNAMANYSYPVIVRDIEVKDNSTSEDYINLYTVQLEDFQGKRFTIRFDVPKFKENRYMVLRGNNKTLNIQSFLMPIIKTDLDTCQVISNYNKIFIRRFGNSAGKSLATTDKLIKALAKYKGEDIKILYGDNSKICPKYDLPIDYIDLAGVYSTITTNNTTFYFNQDELRLAYKVDDSKGLPLGVTKNSKGEDEIVYYNSFDSGSSVAFFIYANITNPELTELFRSAPLATKYMYSKASILNIDIPVIVLCAYTEGLVSTMTKAGIKFDYIEKLEKGQKYNDSTDYIKFEDGYLIYDVTYNSSMLMNGLKECDTANYSLKDINNKKMYLDFLDNYGGRIKSDGLENFADCMIDPITKEILEYYKLPTDYVSVILYASALLSDNKFVKHTTMDGRRLRRGEMIAKYVYDAITSSYSSYANQLRHSRNKATMTLKQSYVIDKILTTSISSDLSTNNVINDIEAANTVSTKGPSGMNSDRAYSLDKRTYDDSMTNVLGMSTGFAGNVGINRQATIDANVEGVRGFIKTTTNKDEMSSAKSLTITEALTPFGTTSDDPFRSAMTFIQTSKHMVRTDRSDPLLVTNGADEAVPYLVSDIFAFKAKQDGVVEELELGKDAYMIVKYKDGTADFIDLSEKIEKNSDGGYNVIVQLSTDLKIGDKVKAGNILAYDKQSFSNNSGEDDNLAANIGTLTRVAILNTDEGYEDSAIVTERLARKLATDIIIAEERYLPKDTNVFLMKNVGEHVEQEDTVLVYQTPYDDEDANTLLKNLAADAGTISELGRKPVKSKVTGELVGIKIYRTCDKDELSDSLRKLVDIYEQPITKKKSIYKKYNIDEFGLPATYKLDPTGKLKGIDDGVKIIFYIKYHDVVAIGDKVVFYSANKGVVKYIIPEGKEPYTDDINEPVDAFVSIGSINGRMVCSTLKYGAAATLMIELDRVCKDKASIPYDVGNV